MEDNSGMCKNVKLTTEVVVAAAVAPPLHVSCDPPSAAASMCNGAGKNLPLKLPQAVNEPEELLGSVTSQNCPGTRASARVIQKMKLDQTRPMTPPPIEREHGKKDEKGAQKTPSQMRAANKTTWTNLERNCFFDALNEFGKDFEAVANCINGKLKRRNTSSDHSSKSKDQVRQHYYQTYHKIAKYVRFTDELKKPAQELYTLINYGEMRRKLQFLSEKHFMKLKQLIYQGHIIVRCKGKNIRIKTPSCKALRRLNQLDDTLEDIRLPSKIEVLVHPCNMEAFGRVQSLAQNPRVRLIVPLYKKLFSFIKTFQFKWRSTDARFLEEQLLTGGMGNDAPDTPMPARPPTPTEPALCFLPKPGVPIHRPLLSITAFLSSVNICLTAYEERLGFKVRSETLESTAAAAAASAKRARTESGSEKRSPESKKPKTIDKTLEELNEVANQVKQQENSSGDELSEEIGELLRLSGDCDAVDSPVIATNPPQMVTQPLATAADPLPQPIALAAATVAAASSPAPSRAKRSEAVGAGGGKGGKSNSTTAANRNFKPLLSDDVIKRIRKGWTVSNAADITIGDLYVVLGQDSKLELEYYWCDSDTMGTTHVPMAASATISTTTTTNTSTSTSTITSSSGSSTSTTISTSSSSSGASTASAASLPYNTNDCDSVERVKVITTSTVSNKLKHLLLVANLSERVRKRQCNCGHSCDRKRDFITKAQWLSSLANGASGVGIASAGSTTTTTTATSDGQETIFRTPMLPVRRPIANIIDPVRQFSKLSRQKLSQQVLVQRCILPTRSDASKPYDLVSVRNLQHGVFEPIHRSGGSITSNNLNRIGIALPLSATSKPTSNLANNLLPQPENANNKNNNTNNNNNNIISSDAIGGLDMPNLDLDSSMVNSSSALPDMVVQDETTTQNLFNGSVSPMHLLRESTSNSRWLEENINDFSLSSLLGHLDDFDATRDILDPSSSLSVISESSVDFRHKFQEISALLQQQEKD